jgi:hypothetical protein
MKPMTPRERFHAVMNFQPFDQLPVVEWAPWWDKTLERWRGEGLDPAQTDRYDICRHFDLDLYPQAWYWAIHWDAPKPKSHGAGLIATMADYEKLRPYLFRMMDTWPVNPEPLQTWAKWQKTGDAVLWFTLNGFFWFPRTLFGIEAHLYAFYDEPELMHRINRENAEWMIRVIDKVCETVTPDFMTFAEDMSYNHGPMISKELFDEFMKPYYEMVLPHLKKRGIRALIDSDGDIHEAAVWFEESGLEGILPLERQAGVDMAKLRADHPRQLYIGAFDKMTMPMGEDAMRAEFERLLPVAAQGGFIISCDHQTPPGVSLENYRIYLRLLREYAKKAGDLSQEILR